MTLPRGLVALGWPLVTKYLSLAGSRQRLFENLRMLPHAPGVQMQPIPEDAVQEDSGDEEEDDPEKRISSRCWEFWELNCAGN